VISEAVAAHGRLEGLNLSDNALGEKGVRAFASGLQGQVTARCPPPLPSLQLRACLPRQTVHKSGFDSMVYNICSKDVDFAKY